MSYLFSLNEKQLEAVQHTEGYLRVIAGAGSGKTKLLVSRYAYLVKDYGIDTANILSVTFTNKAAGEMKRRIHTLIGEEYDTSLICTYHGFCVRVLREDIEKIFFPKEFQIIDAAKQKAILGEIYQKYELKLDHGSFEKTIKHIALKKVDRRYVANMCSTEKCQILEKIETLDDQIAEDFLQTQKQTYSMDFNDLLYFTIDIFERCSDVLEKWQNRLNYIQVDEFQDSSTTEMLLMDILSEKHKNLMIVGDPDQNIYEWRGSDVKLLVDFDKVHQPTKTVFLNQNYRSTPQILKCANTLIEKNEFRLEKELFTNSESGDKVYHYHTKSDFDEADKIVELINKIKKKHNCNYSDFAILYRSGFLSRIIEKKLTENGLPYEIFGGVKFYHRMEIQDIMAYLRLVAFDDDMSFKRIVNTPRRRFGRTKFLHLQSIRKEGDSLLKTLEKNINDSHFKGSGVSELVNAIFSVRQMLQKAPLSEIVQTICSVSGYEKYIRELGDMERFDNMSEFIRIASEYESNFGENVSLSDFINQISLQSEDDSENANDTIKLMTIHSSKGLEFPNVFIIGLSEGIFPSMKTIEERKQLGLEEERRLCYVAITRAEKRLFLMDNSGFSQNSNQKIPSRFLSEIGEENYVRIGKIPKELQNKMTGNKAVSEPAGKSEKKQIGDVVFHHAFGKGEITGYSQNGNSYVIKFEKLNSEHILSVDYFKQKPTTPALPISKQNSTPEPLVTKSKSKSKVNDKSDLSVTKLNDTAEQSALKINHTPEQSAPKPNNTPELSESPAEKKYASENSINDGYVRVDVKSIPEIKSTASSSEQQKSEEKPSAIKAKETDNLWNCKEVPKSGWVCTGITDLGSPSGICQMCGKHVIRYVHHMIHPEWGRLDVGCICAGKMEGNIDAAKRREQDYKNQQSRKNNFMTRKWKMSKNNNSYLKIKDHIIVLYYNQRYNNWKYSLDNVFCVEVYKTREEVMNAAFYALEQKLKK